MPTFKSYTYTARLAQPNEGWDPETKKLTPMSFGDGGYLCDVLDNIALAMEAGVVDNFLWPQQLFADRESFEAFIEELSTYDECYRITDQWWTALAALYGTCNEEGFVTCEEIADCLLKEASEHDKLENFGLKEPKYTYSPEQCIAAYLLQARDIGSNFKLLTQAERNANREIADFGAYYQLDITKKEYEQAKKEGMALVKPVRKASAKKAAKI